MYFSYLALGQKLSPMYSGGTREQVYELYKKYKSEMRRRGLYDKIDPVYHVANELNRQKGK